MSIEATDKEAAAVAVAPRVTLADIENDIDYRFDFTAGTAVANASRDLPTPYPKSLNVLSICILVMRNGFSVIGKSAPASSENYDMHLGKKFAYEDAIRQLWPLMGYALRERLWKEPL